VVRVKWFWVLGFGFRVFGFGFGFLVQGFGFWVRGLWFQEFLSFGFRDLGFRYKLSRVLGYRLWILGLGV
jgi:hypothetical protein